MLASQCWQHQNSFKGSTKDPGTRKPTSARHNTSMSREVTVKELEQRLAKKKERDSRFERAFESKGAPQVSCAKPRPASSLLGAVLCENRPAHSNKMWGTVGDSEVATRLRRMGSESPTRRLGSSLGASPTFSPGVNATARGMRLKPEAPSDQCNLITPEMLPSPATTLGRTGTEMLQEELSKVSYYHSPAIWRSEDRGSLEGADALGIGAFNAMRKAGVSTSSASLPTTITKSTVAGSLRTIGLNTTANIVRGSNTATDPEFNNRTAISASGTATPSSASSRRSSISLQQVETHSESEASVSTTTSFSVFQPAPPCSSGASSNTSTIIIRRRSERRTHDAKKWWVERVASEAHMTRKRDERVLEKRLRESRRLEQGW